MPIKKEPIVPGIMSSGKHLALFPPFSVLLASPFLTFYDTR
jgi:hypothetical protein